MTRPDPTQKIKPDIPALIDALAAHGVVWLLAGSYVLTLYGAKIEPNDLDVVVRRDQDNLERLAGCLNDLDAVPFFSGDPRWDLGTPDDHRAWRPEKTTPKDLDHLFVTRHGMLDIPFAMLPEYDALIGGCSPMEIDGRRVDVCDPRMVLDTLETLSRRKDSARASIYAEMRARFGLPPSQDDMADHA